MKYKGKPLVQESQRLVKFKKTKPGKDEKEEAEILAFVVSPMRFGFEEWIADKGIIAPTPPKKPVEANGKHVRGFDNALEMEIDENDPDYLSKERDYGRRLIALRLVEVLRQDPNTEFETSEPELKDDDRLADKKWRNYADNVAAELEQTSLTFSEVEYLLGVAQEISIDFDIEEATKSFLPDQGSDQKEDEAS